MHESDGKMLVCRRKMLVCLRQHTDGAFQSVDAMHHGSVEQDVAPLCQHVHERSGNKQVNAFAVGN